MGRGLDKPKKGVLGVLCCFGLEFQLLKVELTGPFDETALVTPFQRHTIDDERLKTTIRLGVCF